MRAARIALTLGLLALCGCGAARGSASSHPNDAVRPARVDLAALVRVHPLYPMLVNDARELAALRAIERNDAAAPSALAATAASAGLARSLAPADAALQRIASQDSATFGRIEQSAARDLSNIRPVPFAPETASANAYRVVLQNQASQFLASYDRALDARASLQYRNTAQAMLERRLTLGFDLSRADAGRRTQLETRLRDLDLAPAERRADEAALRAMDAREANAVARLRAQDARVLATLRARQAAADARDAAAMAQSVNAKTAANAAQRERVVAAAGPVVPPATVGAFAPSVDFSSQPLRIAGDLRGAQRDLSARFSELAQTDRNAATALRTRIATLEADRETLRREIEGQILGQAARIARQKGLGTVFSANVAPHDCVDLTAAVRAWLRDFET